MFIFLSFTLLFKFNYVFYIHPIGHFRVAFCLCVKTSLNAKPFIWLPPTGSFFMPIKLSFRTKNRCETKAQGKFIHELPHRGLWLRNVMPRLVDNNNGLLDRFLILLPATAPVALSTRMDNSKSLRNSNLSSFDRIYDKIYAKHNTGDQVKYSLSHEALDVYVRHMDENIP